MKKKKGSCGHERSTMEGFEKMMKRKWNDTCVG